MRRFAQVVVAVLALVLLALVLVPWLMRDRLLALVVDQANQNLNATVTVGGASASFFGDFPHLSVTLEDVVVANHAPFEGVKLAELGELSLSVDLKTLLQKKELDLRSLTLRQAKIRVLSDAEGRSNTDITKASDTPSSGEETSSPFHLRLQHYALEDVDLEYAADGLVVDLKDLDHEGEGDFTQDLIDLATQTQIGSLTVVDGGVTLLRETRWDARMALVYDQNTGGITLGDNEITINALRLAISGSAVPNDQGWQLDLGLGALETSFKGLLSLVPSVYSDSFEGLGSTGTLALSGTVKGLLPNEGDDLPGFDLKLRVQDGSFKDPSLSSGVTGIDLDGSVTHPGGGLDGLVVDLRRFAMTVEGAPLAGSLRLSHLDSDPTVDLAAKGKIDLSKLRAALPASAATYTGLLDADIAVAGPLSAFEQSKFDAVKADGRFKLTQFQYTDPELPVPVSIDTMSLDLSPSAANLSELRMKLGDSDLDAVGRVDNVVAWALSDAPLSGNLTLKSNTLNLDPWSSEEEEEQASSSPESSIFVVPEGYNFTVAASVKHLIYDGSTYEDVQGTMVLRDGQMRFDGLQVALLGGALAMNGSYSASTAEAADVDMTFTLGNPELAAALAHFESLRRLASIVEDAKGTFRAELRVKTRLGPDLSPDLSTLWSEGSLTAYGVSFQPGFMKEVAKALGKPDMARLTLSDRNLHFKVQEGRAQIKPVAVMMGGTAATLSGSSGVADGSLDYTLNLKMPASQLSASSLASRIGSDLSEVEVLVKVGGTLTDPKVKLELAGAAEALVDELKAEATAQVEEVKQEITTQVTAAVNEALTAAIAQGDKLVADAKLAADKLRAEGKTAADKVRSESKAQAKKLRQEAKDPLSQAAADKAANKLVAEGEEKAKGIEREANKKAKALEDGAAAKRDQLVKEAEAKVKP